MLFTDTAIVPLFCIAVLISDFTAIIPFVWRLYKGIWPRTSDFAAVSICVYYSIGLLSEFGQNGQVGDILPFFKYSSTSVVISLALMALAPWLLHAGSICSSGPFPAIPLKKIVAIPRKMRMAFLLGTVSLCTIIGFQGLYAVLGASSIWMIRKEFEDKWGPYVLWFYIPLAFAPLLVSTDQVRGKWGKLLLCFVALCGVCAALPMGERTMVLLPFLIIFMFAGGLSLKRFVVVPLAAVMAAALLLPIFKWQFGDSDDEKSTVELIAATIHTDISRAGVLAEAVSRSKTLGSSSLAYPLAGYVYSAVFFVPRPLVPWKGSSTSQSFTADVSSTIADQTNWNYGMGLIEELLINCGLLPVLPGLFVYGLVLGLFDRLNSPALIIPIRLAMLWAGGYHLPALLLTFGPMVALSALTLAAIYGSAHFSLWGRTALLSGGSQ